MAMNQPPLNDAPQVAETQEELLARINEGHRRFYDEYKPEKVTTPELHHYTTVTGLAGILETSSIFGTHIEFLNDTSEVTHAYEVASKVFKELEADPNLVGGLVGKEIAEYGRFFFAYPDILRRDDAFVTSFCESDDLLSQWREYGMGGFAVGFNPLASEGTFAIESSLWKTTISKVLYDYDLKKVEIIRIIASAIKAKGKVASGPKKIGMVSMIRTVCAVNLQTWVHSVKHPSFGEEKEWRLISFSVPNMLPLNAKHDFLVRTSNGQLVPTSMISLCQEGKSSPDALRRSA
jgi:hypothetical protein